MFEINKEFINNLSESEKVNYAAVKQMLKKKFEVVLMIIEKKIVNVILIIKRLNKINIRHVYIIIRALNLFKALKKSNEVNKTFIIIF